MNHFQKYLLDYARICCVQNMLFLDSDEKEFYENMRTFSKRILLSEKLEYSYGSMVDAYYKNASGFKIKNNILSRNGSLIVTDFDGHHQLINFQNQIVCLKYNHLVKNFNDVEEKHFYINKCFMQLPRKYYIRISQEFSFEQFVADFKLISSAVKSILILWLNETSGIMSIQVSHNPMSEDNLADVLTQLNHVKSEALSHDYYPSLFNDQDYDEPLGPLLVINQPKSYDLLLFETKAIFYYILHTFPLDSFFLCFDGGKDSNVLLNIFCLMLEEFLSEKQSLVFVPMVLYLRHDPMEELEHFLYQTIIAYNAYLVEIDAKEGFKDACQTFSELYPDRKVCIMGNRRGDAYSLNNLFQFTDSDWPKLLRVFPILNWDYQDVWAYILDKKFPYCKLYDEGYTSLGKKSSTIKNETLLINGSDQYLPAHKLTQIGKERDSRI